MLLSWRSVTHSSANFESGLVGSQQQPFAWFLETEAKKWLFSKHVI